MATVFERLEEHMKKLVSTVEELRSSIEKNNSSLETVRKEFNSAFMNFSDLIGRRIDDLAEMTGTGVQGSGVDIKSIKSELSGFIREMRNTTNKFQNIMDTAIDKIRQLTISTIAPAKVTQPTVTPPRPFIKETIESADLLPQAKRAPIPIKVGKTVPAEVLDLLDTLKTKIELPAVKFAALMEEVRDEIVRIYKFHPAIYELGTFARKLRKYPQNMKIDPDVLTMLFDKIEEWKRRIGGQE